MQVFLRVLRWVVGDMATNNYPLLILFCFHFGAERFIH